MLGQNTPLLRIDPSKAYGGLVSEYFGSVEYIPLETTKESLFGTLHQYYITDSSIVIYDKDTRSILFFNLDGKFITRVFKYNSLRSAGLAYDEIENRMIIWFSNATNTQNENIPYTLLGEKIHRTQSLKKTPAGIKDPIDFGDGYLGSANRYTFDISDPIRRNEDSLLYLINIFKGNKFYKSVLPLNIVENLGYFKLGGGIGSTKNNISNFKKKFVSLDFLNTVYLIDKDTSIRAFQVQFPINYEVPKALLFSKDIHYIDSIKKTNRWYNNKTIKSISNILILDDLLIFKTNGVSYSIYDEGGSIIPHNFIYNLKTLRLTAFERITPDSLSHYLPILDPIWSTFKGVVIKNNQIFAFIPSLQLFLAKDATKSRNPQYPPVLQEYFRTQTRKSNPVIVRMKLKE